MNKENIKLFFRYFVLAFIMYLAYKVTSLEYVSQMKDSQEGVLQVTTGSVFTALGWVLKSHFDTKINKD